jgi:hypothetical protein
VSENLAENIVGELFTPLSPNHYIVGSLLSLIAAEDDIMPNSKLYAYIEEVDVNTGIAITRKVLF